MSHHNWMTIIVAYGYTGKVCLGIDSSRLGFAPPTMKGYSPVPLGITVSSSSGQTHVIEITWDTGIREQVKRTKPVTMMTGTVINVLIIGIPIKVL
jgi:hypothetical protein